jgi:hypothetical protein
MLGKRLENTAHREAMKRLTKTQLANLFTQPRERPGTNEKKSHRPCVIGDPEIGEMYVFR